VNAAGRVTSILACPFNPRITLILLAVLLASCGRSSQPVVGMVPKGSHHIFWEAVRNGALKAGEEFSVNVEWISPASEADVQRQIEIVDTLVARRVSAIALAPIDKKSLVGPVHLATQKRIPVAIFDSGLETDEYVSYVATDNAGGGRLAARRMGKILNRAGDVAIVSFMPGSAATIEREQAFQDEVRLLFPLIRVVALQYGMADQSRAELVTEEILRAHPNLSGIFTDNESSSIGAARALKKQVDRHTKLVAFDSSRELIAGLKAGNIDSLVVQDPFRMGYETIRGLAAKLAGKQPPVFVDSGVRLVVSADLESPQVRQLIFYSPVEFLKSTKQQ
jgi:ribose transport system substrate-binding protein